MMNVILTASGSPCRYSRHEWRRYQRCSGSCKLVMAVGIWRRFAVEAAGAPRPVQPYPYCKPLIAAAIRPETRCPCLTFCSAPSN